MEIASVLFAAGRGLRLRPLTDTIPKPALPLLDVPLGAFALARLVTLAPVLVNVSHLGDQVVGALQPFGSFEVLREAPDAFGTAGTLEAVMDRLAETFVTLNSDALLDLDPGLVVTAHRSERAPATIAVRSVDAGADMQETGGRVTRFVDRRREPNVAGYQFLGLAVFERAAISELPLARPGGLGEQILAPLVADGRLHAFVHDGYFTDVGTHDRYLAANIDLLDGRGPALPNALLGRVVEVDGGRAYVGPGALVPEDVLGPGSIVMANAQVADGARLTRVVVMPQETVPAVTLSDAIWHGGRPRR